MKLRQRFYALLRVSCALTLLLAASMALFVREAKAAFSESILSASAAFLDVAPEREIPRTLALNGLEFSVESHTVPEDLASVLSRFRDRCRTRTVAIPRPLPSTLEVGGRHEAAIACLDTERTLEWNEFWSRFSTFSETLDLASMGTIRYLFAKESKGRTSFLLVSSKGSLPLRKAFPKEGDAPGVDVTPRLAGGTRFLSAAETGHPYAVTAYRFPRTTEWTAPKYAALLQENGFRVTESSAGTFTAARENSTYFFRFASRSKGPILTVVRL